MIAGDPAIWHHGPAGVTRAGVQGMGWIRTNAGGATQRVGVRSESQGWTIHAECNPSRAEGGGQALIQPGDTLELSVECELWAAKPEFPAETPAMLQLA